MSIKLYKKHKLCVFGTWTRGGKIQGTDESAGLFELAWLGLQATNLSIEDFNTSLRTFFWAGKLLHWRKMWAWPVFGKNVLLNQQKI